MSWQDVQDNWKPLGSALTLLSTGYMGLRRIGGPRKLLLALRSQWNLNKVILDMDLDLARAKANEARALKGEAEANKRTEDLATTLQTMLSAVAAVKEAQASMTPSPSLSNVLTPPPATSTILPQKPIGPLDNLGR